MGVDSLRETRVLRWILKRVEMFAFLPVSEIPPAYRQFISVPDFCVQRLGVNRCCCNLAWFLLSID